MPRPGQKIQGVNHIEDNPEIKQQDPQGKKSNSVEYKFFQFFILFILKILCVNPFAYFDTGEFLDHFIIFLKIFQDFRVILFRKDPVDPGIGNQTKDYKAGSVYHKLHHSFFSHFPCDHMLGEDKGSSIRSAGQEIK